MQLFAKKCHNFCIATKKHASQCLKNYLKSLILRTKPKNEKGCVILSEICFIAGTMLVLSHDFGMKIQIYLV